MWLSLGLIIFGTLLGIAIFDHFICNEYWE